MPNFTRKAIKESFLKLLSQRPLSQITVKDIVEDCGINRNSFYYHFADLPALVEEIGGEMVSDLMARYPTISSVEQSFDAVVDFLAQNKRAIYHIYNSVSRDIFERHMMELCHYVAAAYIEAAMDGQPPEDIAVLVRFHRCACFGTAIHWLNSGMKDDIAAYFRQICRLRPGWPTPRQSDTSLSRV